MTSVIYSDQLSVDLFRCCQELTEEKKFTEIICHSKIWTWLEILFFFQKDCICEVSGPPPLYQTWSLIVSNLITLFIVVSRGGTLPRPQQILLIRTLSKMHQRPAGRPVDNCQFGARVADQSIEGNSGVARPEHPGQLKGNHGRALKANHRQQGWTLCRLSCSVLRGQNISKRLDIGRAFKIPCKGSSFTSCKNF